MWIKAQVTMELHGPQGWACSALQILGEQTPLGSRAARRRLCVRQRVPREGLACC